MASDDKAEIEIGKGSTRCGQSCKRECSLRSLGLNHQHPRLFYSAEWRWPPLVYVIYRVVWAMYFFAWAIWTGLGNARYATTEANRVKWFIYLTNWTHSVLATCLIVQAVTSVYCYVSYTRRGKELDSMPWYLKMQWVWYNVAINSALLVSTVYWGLLYASNPLPLEEINFHTHGFNSIFVVIDLFITATPLHLLHFLHGLTYSLIYAIFSLIYTFSGGTNGRDRPYIYSVLDWLNNPGKSAMYSLPLIFVGSPVFWLICYGLYQLRVLMAKTCCSECCGRVLRRDEGSSGQMQTTHL